LTIRGASSRSWYFFRLLPIPKDSDLIRFDQDFAGRIRALPGIVGVVSTSVVPLTGGGNTIRFVIEGQPMPIGQENESNIRDISAGYFSMMEIR